MSSYDRKKRAKSNVDATEGDDPSQAEYKVGYGKPPTHTRFKRGQSGNPKGRKRNLNGIDVPQDLRDVFLQEVATVDNGAKRRMSMIVFLIEQLVRAGAKGNTRAAVEAVKLARELGTLKLQQKVGLDLSALTPEEDAKCSEAIQILRRHRIFKG